jgi:hypothetical protein
MGCISLPSGPVLPNTNFCSPVHKFVHLIFHLAFCSDHREWHSKVAVKLFVRLVGSEQADMKNIMNLHCVREPVVHTVY